MDVKEHDYADDPNRGPRDVQTTLEGVDYFFLGNGHIQAAVQVCSSGAGTPLGLLIMRPERLGPKRDALTMDPQAGLAPTMIRIHEPGSVWQAVEGNLEAVWSDTEGIPTVSARWQAGELGVEERFWCPDVTTPRLVREVWIQNRGAGDRNLTVKTGPEQTPLLHALRLSPGESRRVSLVYRLTDRNGMPRVEATWSDDVPPEHTAVARWSHLTDCRLSSDLLNHLFAAARRQLPAVIAAAGRVDGSIWQYNLEWVRDQSAIAQALVMLGDFELARTMLDRLLREFVSEEGDPLDSSRRRSAADVELDQCGELLLALKTYLDWTGDASILHEHWPRIRAVAEFPLREEFRHSPSGLLHNRREYWERHAAHGIEEGMELAQQVFVSLGLSAAAELAGRFEHLDDAARWQTEADRLKRAALADERFGLVHEGRLIKRRKVTGKVHSEVHPMPGANLPPGTPLAGPGPHRLNPDTCSVLPIALEFVDPRGEIARNTLAAVEELWNQRWDGGGYGRYHVSSEPDSPGPWPFASVFVARAYWEAGDDKKVWRTLRWLGEAVGGRAGSWFEFDGPRPVPPCPQVGIIPWTWAEIVAFFVHHVFGVRPGLSELVLRPRLPSRVDRAETTVRIGGHCVRLAARQAAAGESPMVTINGAARPWRGEELHLPRPDNDLRIEAVLENVQKGVTTDFRCPGNE